MKIVDELNESIKCLFCSETHQIPKNGFPKDKRVEKLINIEYHRIDYGEAHSEATYLCEEFNEMIGDFETLTKEPQNYIEDYFKKLINEIDLRREESKEIIDKWHENCYQEIRKYQSDFLAKLSKEFPHKNEIIDEFKTNLNLWKNKLAIPELSKKEFSFEKIESNLDSSIKILSKEIDAYKEKLLDGNTFQLVEKELISLETLGQIKVEKKVLLNFI